MSESIVSYAAARPTGVFFTENTPDSLIDAVKHYQSLKLSFKPEALRQHAARFSRAEFKARMKRFIERSDSKNGTWLGEEEENVKAAQRDF